MAWTIRHPDGDVSGSGSFLVTEQDGAVSPVPPAESPRDWVAAAIVLLLLLAAAGAFVAAELVDALGEQDPSVETASVTTITPPATAPGTAPTTVPTATMISAPTPSIRPTATTTLPRSTTSTSTTSTSSTSTSSTSTSTTTTSTTTTSTTSTSTTTTSSTVPDGPRVVVEGRVEDCRFGADCLIVGFVIEDFGFQPNEYVCEFGDGSRTTFRFGGTSVETACSQSGASPAITVEVAGVRSETLTRDDVS
jgi:hypothetical protein